MDTHDASIERSQIRLNDGRTMPQLGLGTYGMTDDAAPALVAAAIRAGYRAIDTASVYDNERGVGAGVRDSGVARDELFVTTKLWKDDLGHDAALRAFDRGAARLALDPVDLVLIHWPSPRRGLFVETWKALIRLRDEGRVRSIGVSNFGAAEVERIIDDTGVKPVLNQIELHPRFQQVELRAWLDENDIRVQSWSPLGQGQVLADPTIAPIAAKHRRSPAQVVIRWHLDQGLLAIPKASDAAHMRDNLTVAGFALDDDDIAAIAALDDEAGRIGPDPDVF